MSKKISPSIIKKNLRSASSSNQRIHIAPRGDRWSARREGTTKGRNFSTQRGAIAYANSSNRARNIVVHGQDGKIKRWK